MVVPRVYVRRGTTVWSVTHIRLTDSLTQDALTLIFLYLYTKAWANPGQWAKVPNYEIKSAHIEKKSAQLVFQG